MAKKTCLSKFMLMHLPIELQTEIFLKLSGKSLSACKLVCKHFHTLVQNPEFQNTHVTRHDSSALILEFGHKNSLREFDYNSHVLVSIDNTTKDVISYEPFTPYVPYVGMLFLVGSCNGLVCFAVRKTGSMSRSYDEKILLLWNPVTKQSKYLPLPQFKDQYYYDHGLTMEFYYVPETNDYIIISLGDVFDDIRFALYKMSTNSWTFVASGLVAPHGDFYNRQYTCFEKRLATSVFVKGSFHWIFEVNTEPTQIVSFNLETEKVSVGKTIDLHLLEKKKKPIGYDPFGTSSLTLDIGVQKESLAVIYSSGKEIEMRVMKDNGVEDSRVFQLSHNNARRWPHGLWNNNLMTSDEEFLYFYDTGKLMRLPPNSYLSGFSSFSHSRAPVW